MMISPQRRKDAKVSIDMKIFMQSTTKLVLALIALLSATPGTVSAQERYLIAYAGFAGFQSPLWATKELGLLTKHGINADLVLTPGSTRQIQAMLGNSVHFAQVDAVTTINAIAQGAERSWIWRNSGKDASNSLGMWVFRHPKSV